MKWTIEILRQMALSSNIIDIGVIRPEKSEHLKQLLLQRCRDKRVTSFEEQEIERRINPALLMPTVKSIIVAVMSYHTLQDADTSKRPSLYGTLARCALGMDYHRIFHGRMKEMMVELERREPGMDWNIYVDTGPLVDRHLAATAGLGFFGRNNCFIHPRYGSFVVIGYALTNLEFDEHMYTSQSYEKCGECGTCQSSCPVNALQIPFQLDQKRCLSHCLQQKGIMEENVLKQTGAMMYGCDICQDVCPHNQGVPSTPEPLFEYREEDAWLDLPELLKLSNREFNRRFRSRSFGWRGRRVMQRNALKSLGNLGKKEALPYIEVFLEDQRNEIRWTAQWAARQIKLLEEEK